MIDQLEPSEECLVCGRRAPSELEDFVFTVGVVFIGLLFIIPVLICVGAYWKLLTF